MSNEKVLYVGFIAFVFVAGMATGALWADFNTQEDGGDTYQAEHQVIANTQHSVIYRFTDEEAGVTCYASASGGMSCISTNSTELDDGLGEGT